MQFAGLSLPMIEQFVDNLPYPCPCLPTSQNICISSNQVESKSHINYVFEERVDNGCCGLSFSKIASSSLPNLVPAAHQDVSTSTKQPTNQQSTNH